MSSLGGEPGSVAASRRLALAVLATLLLATVGTSSVATAASSKLSVARRRTQVPPIPPVLSTTELGPVRQNAVIKGRDGAQSALFQGTSIWMFGDTILTVPGHDGDNWANDTLSS